MTNQKIAELIDVLFKKTSGDSPVRWQRTATKDMFIASFPKYSLQISKAVANGLAVPNITIINSEGEVIETIFPKDLSDYFQDAYDVLNTIYENARMQAFGVDIAVDELLAYLK